MKKFFVSAGIAAISAMTLHADEYAPDFTAMDATKPWSVSGTLRGFYDDNFTTSPNGSKQGSGGFEFSPQVSLIVPLQQTELALRYTYGLFYYQKRESQGANPIDQSHQVDLWVDHAFTQATKGKVEDIFTSQQDPALTASGVILPYRVNGNNIQNVGTITLQHEWSQLFATDLTYQNTWLDYQQHGATVGSLFPPVPPFSLPPPTGVNSAATNIRGATYAGLLNQIENSGTIQLNYIYRPDLTFTLAYTFAWTSYTGNEPIAPNFILGVPLENEIYFSQNRNLMSHNISVGAQYTATANLSIQGQVGFVYNNNYNLPSFSTQSADSYQPSASVAVTYTYLPGDYVQVGLTENSIPVATADPSQINGSITKYQQATSLYTSVNHQITPKLTGSLTGNYQFATYVGGANDGASQDFASLGLNLAYAFTPWVSADVGYNFYYLTSTPALAGYSRNVGYASVTASF